MKILMAAALFVASSGMVLAGGEPTARGGGAVPKGSPPAAAKPMVGDATQSNLSKGGDSTWLAGPTLGYADGPFVGVAAGYDFGGKKPTLIGALTVHRWDGGVVNYTPPHKRDPSIPYANETGPGIAVTVLWHPDRR